MPSSGLSPEGWFPTDDRVVRPQRARRGAHVDAGQRPSVGQGDVAVRAHRARRHGGDRQRSSRRAAGGPGPGHVGVGAARADGHLPRAAADRRLRGDRRRPRRRHAARQRRPPSRRRADAAVLRPHRRPDRVLRAAVRSVPARPVRPRLHGELCWPGHGDPGPVAVLPGRLHRGRTRPRSSSCSSPTSSPTSGSATPSRRPTGAICGSTSPSPATPSGCGSITSGSGTSRPRRRRTSASARARPSRPASRRRGNLFGYERYDGGAVVVHALRGQLGDEAFFELLRRWVADNDGTSRTSADFIALAEEIGRQQLDEFFATWLYADALPPEYPVSLPSASTWAPEGSR